MSAPQTNLDKQKKRHWGPLAGIVLVLVLVSGMVVLMMGYLADTETPEAPETPAAVTAPLPADGAPATPRNDPGPSPQIMDQPATPTAPAD